MKRSAVISVFALVVVAGLVLYERHRSAAVRNSPEQIDSSGEPAPAEPRHSASPESTGFAAEPAGEASVSNLISRLEAGDMPRLTAEQVEPYLEKNRRSAESLLAAFRATADRAFLREAMEKYPTDPRVDLLAYYRAFTNDYSEIAFPERRRWLDAFKESAPDNALANYLSARDDFKAGRTERALQELSAAADKPNLQDYVLDSIQNTEEAYRAAGYCEVEAKAIAMNGLVLRHMTELRFLTGDLLKLAETYQRSGDDSGVQNTLRMALQLGQRLDQPGTLTLIPTMVGIEVQRKALGMMNPSTPYGSSGQTVQNQIDALAQRRESLSKLGPQTRNALRTMPNQDLVSYFDRTRLFGEEAAQRWVLRTHGLAE